MHLDLQLIHLLLAQASSEMVSMEGWLSSSLELYEQSLLYLLDLHLRNPGERKSRKNCRKVKCHMNTLIYQINHYYRITVMNACARFTKSKLQSGVSNVRQSYRHTHSNSFTLHETSVVSISDM